MTCIYIVSSEKKGYTVIILNKAWQVGARKGEINPQLLTKEKK